MSLGYAFVNATTFFFVAFNNVNVIMYRFRGLYGSIDAPYLVKSGRFDETCLLKKYHPSEMNSLRVLLIIDERRIVIAIINGSLYFIG